MANLVRGFRRIGWVITAPVAALLCLVFFDRAMEFSASNYKVERLTGSVTPRLYMQWFRFSGLDHPIKMSTGE
jgi:hypothetical protein